MHHERGQTATEYLGVLVIVAGIVLAISLSPLGTAVADGIQRGVCQMAGKSACGDKPATTRAEDSSFGPAQIPDDGGTSDRPPTNRTNGPSTRPALANGPKDIPAMPFPGSSTVQCTISAVKPSTGCSGSGKGAAGVRMKATTERSQDKLNALGCPVTTVSVTGSYEAYGKGKATVKGVGPNVDFYTGKSTTYGVTVTPARADAIAAGEDPPNPLDPTTLKLGEGIEMSDKYYEGVKLGAEFGAVAVADGYERGTKYSTGVRRMDANTVRVYAGDSEYVKRALSIGNSNAFKVRIGADEEVARGKLRAVDMDISTPAGWAAYQRFAATGAVPQAGAVGTKKATTMETTAWTAQSKLGAEFGPIDATLNLGEGEANVTQTTDGDGAVTATVDARDGDTGFQITAARDAAGNLNETRYAVNINGVSPDQMTAFQRQNGLPVQDTGGTARLEFSGEDLQQMQAQAFGVIRQEYEGRGGQLPTDEEIRTALKTPGGILRGKGIKNRFAAELARADGPPQMLSAVYQAARNRKLDDFITFAGLAARYQTNGQQLTAPLVEGARFPGQQVVPSCA